MRGLRTLMLILLAAVFAAGGPLRALPCHAEIVPPCHETAAVEDSVYVGPDAVGKGVGKALLSALIAACEGLGLRQMCAVIGDSGNAASIGLHAALGFERKGVFPDMGYKFGRWVDLVWMQRSLNGGGAREPDAPGMELSGV